MLGPESDSKEHKGILCTPKGLYLKAQPRESDFEAAVTIVLTQNIWVLRFFFESSTKQNSDALCTPQVPFIIYTVYYIRNGIFTRYSVKSSFNPLSQSLLKPSFHCHDFIYFKFEPFPKGPFEYFVSYSFQYKNSLLSQMNYLWQISRLKQPRSNVMLAKDRDDQSLVLDCKVEARVWTFIIEGF